MIDTAADIKRRKSLCIDAMNKLKNVWKNNRVSTQNKLKIFIAFITSISLYDSELSGETARWCACQTSTEGGRTSMSYAPRTKKNHLAWCHEKQQLTHGMNYKKAKSYAQDREYWRALCYKPDLHGKKFPFFRRKKPADDDDDYSLPLLKWNL